MLAVALALAACTATPGGGSTRTDPTGAAVDPIETYLAAAENDWRNATRTHFASNQDKIAACMTAAGFDYTPSTLPPAPQPANHNTEAWVAKHGYGMSADDMAEAERSEIILNTPYGIDAPEQTAYLAQLTNAERDAYNTALSGTDEEQKSGKQGGCMAKQPIDPRFTPAATKLAQDSFSFWDKAAADPRTTKAQSDWSACMAGKGHDGLATPDDAYAKISDLYSGGGSSKSGRSPSDSATPGPADDSQLAAARTAELAMALDDFDCKVSTRYVARTTEVLFALENTWISTHKAELDDVIAGYRQAST